MKTAAKRHDFILSLAVIGATCFTLASNQLHAQPFINIAFGSPPGTKVGLAATGQSTNDFWNAFYFPGSRSASLTNLAYADGSLSGVAVTDARGAQYGTNTASDPMYSSFIYTQGLAITLTLTNLPVANYDIYFYGHGPSNSASGSYTLTVGSTTNYGIASTLNGPGWDSPVWQEGVQYVVFRGVQVTNTPQLVTLTARAAEGTGFSLLSGVQFAPAVPQAPFVLTQPTDQTAPATSNATFKVAAAGTYPLKYQWLFNGAKIAGATASLLNLSHVQASNEGSYSVTISNAYGGTTSTNASLTVTPVAPFIVTQPQGRTVVAGTNVTFYVIATGSTPFTYQWQFFSAPISGATDSLITITNVQTTNEGIYSVLVSNAVGWAVSSNANLAVLPRQAPGATTLPATSIGTNNAVLNGSVNPNGLLTGAGFDWGLTTNYDHSTTRFGVGSGFSPVAYSASLGSLVPGTTYHFRIVATNIVGRSNGEDRTFTTPLPTGQLDGSFNPDVSGPSFVVHGLAVQSDGKILVGGVFTNLAGVSRANLGRLNPDGTYDDSWAALSANGVVYAAAVQTNGGILVAGGFTSIGGQTGTVALARLDASGNVATNFNALLHSATDNPSVQALAIQADGKILIGGIFNSLGGQARTNLGRLNADGTLDTSFNAGASGVGTTVVFTLVEEPDGRILVGGQFTTLAGHARTNLGRLEASGALDDSFNPAPNGNVSNLALHHEGMILVGGAFSQLGGLLSTNLGRLNPNGSLDTTFNPKLFGAPNSLAVQVDGKILLGGSFTFLGGQGHPYLGRLNPDGTLDTGFFAGPNNSVFALAAQADGKILVGGSFTSLGGQPRTGLGRVVSGSDAVQTLALDGTETVATWSRSGAGPEVEAVTFEQSTDNITYNLLGTGARISGGCQITGLTPPSGQTFYLRARGRTSGGHRNSSSGIIETVQAFPAVATPTILPNGGTFTNFVQVALDCATVGAAIRYTLDGSPPTASSSLYDGLLILTNSATLQARAFAAGYHASDPASASFTIVTYIPDTNAPTITAFDVSPSAATVGSSFVISYTVTDTGGSGLNQARLWRASIDGTTNDPSWHFLGSPAFLSGDGPVSGAFTNTPGTPGNYWYSVRVADNAGNLASDREAGLGPKEITVNPLPTAATPTILPNGGTFTNSVQVSLNCATAGAEIHYTLDGTPPTAGSSLYNGALTLSNSVTLKARAFAAGYNDSDVAAASFTIIIVLPDTQGPALTITSPTNTAVLRSASLVVHGTASDHGFGDSGVSSVLINGVAASGGTAIGGDTAHWEASLTLTTGSNHVTVVAQDGLSNATTKEISVFYQPDTSAPSVKITYPTSDPSYQATNSTLTLSGTASDDVGVTQVTWSNSRGGSGVVSGTSHWYAFDIHLQVGTNILTVTAYDAAGNTNTATLSVVLPPAKVLTIIIHGNGTVTPNLNGHSLVIGGSYTITAVPGTGSVFSNWTGNVFTNTATLTFVMQSNMVLQANFTDVKRPSLSITYPLSGQRVTNTTGQVTVRGGAGDNVQVTNVQIQLNGGDWTDAVTANGWTNWTAIIAPLPRTNVLRAFAEDASGYYSATNSVMFLYVVTSPLTLITNGLGGITRTFTGDLLEVGKTYSVTAVPSSGQLFSNWEGSLTSTNAHLYFVMQSNMVLQANFIPNPFLPAKGTYNGLFGETDRAHERSGSFTLTLEEQGAYSANLHRGTNIFTFSGQFDLAGHASRTVSIGIALPWIVTMNLDLGATAQQLTGSVGNDFFSADLLAYRRVFNAVTNPADQFAGLYTLILSGSAIDDGGAPLGDGYGVVTVGRSGYVSLSGFLADGSALSPLVPLSSQGDWPLYQSRYAGGGSVWGWLKFDTNNPAAEVSGQASWIRPPIGESVFYPLGFTNLSSAAGARYTPPTAKTNRVINLTNGVVIFDGGNLPGSFTNTITLTATNRVLNGNTNPFYLTITLTNGTFAGSVKVPGTTNTTTFKGALLQDQDEGFGYFLGTNQSGRLFLGAP